MDVIVNSDIIRSHLQPLNLFQIIFFISYRSVEFSIGISIENPIEISIENPIGISIENPIGISIENPIGSTIEIPIGFFRTGNVFL